MPQAIPFIIQAAAVYFGANVYVVAAIIIAANALVSNYQKRKAQRAARDAYNASLEDRLVMTATANAARSVIYGRARNVDGVVFKGTHGTNSEYFTLAVAIAGHEIDGFEKLFLNDQPLSLLSDGVAVTGGAVGGVGYWVTTDPYSRPKIETVRTTMTVTGGAGSVVAVAPPVSGSVSVTNFNIDGNTYQATPVVVGTTISVSGAPVDGTYDVVYQSDDVKRSARVWMYTGAAGQTLYPLLSTRFPGLLTISDKFSGMAIVVMELRYDQDAFPAGVPSLTAVVRGKKILDTRTGITAWSENPAMIARDWALYKYGGDCTTADLNEASFIAAANACDTVTVFNTTAGNETRPLYQCGIVCKTDVNPDDHFGEMVESMAGKWGFAGGQLKVVAGVYRAPVAAITDLWLSTKKSVIVTKDQSKQDLVNCYKPLISNADGYIDGVTGPVSSVTYTSTPMPAVRSQTFIDADGQELIRENTMLGVTRNVHAQHICGVQMRDMRDGLTVQLGCNMRAWPLELFDVVTLTLPVFGFAAKQFEVLGWKYTLEDGVQLLMKETAASIYAVNSGLDVLDASPNTTLPLPWVVEQVTGVVVTSGTVTLEDGWPTTRTQVVWNQVASESVRQSGTIEIQYTLASAALPTGDWPAVFEQGSATKTVISGLLANQAYVFRVRARNTLGVAGKWSVQKTHIITEPPLVDSPIIEDEAATVVVTSISASGTTQGPLIIATTSWPNTTDGNVQVTCDYSIDINSTSASTVHVSFSYSLSGGGGAAAFISPEIGTQVTNVNKINTVTVPPGYTITVYLNKPELTAHSLVWTNAVARLTANIR